MDKGLCLPFLCILFIYHAEGNILDVLERSLSRTKNSEFKNVMHQHGGIKMGVKNDFCDNGEDYLENDWDPNSIDAYKSYECLGQGIKTTELQERTTIYCEKENKAPIHRCMDEKIEYKDRIPLSGSHRPLWPVYGEYRYIPPQRWVHALEHGAAVFLYHPCVDDLGIFRELARACLRRHILTPYNRLSRKQPFAIVTWGCRLTLSKLTFAAINAAINFIKSKAVRKDLPEWRVWQHGQYNKTLIHKADIVTDKEDSKLCPVY